MTFQQLKTLIRSDLYRYTGKVSTRLLLMNLLRNPGFQYSFYLRISHYARNNRNWPLYVIAKMWMEHYSCKYGIFVSTTNIGSGFYIGHFSGIFVGGEIGKNCNVSQGVTIGHSNRGKNKGLPTLGDNVYVGPGAKIVGNVKIGNNVAIGANCVVTKDIPDNAVVVGIPGKVISYNGSTGYINNTDYL
ncbi:MAG: transferase hexapeptide repeat containing protein [Firmicutes bacterium]|nr:transferase hexapeptide repeat containing protein [Bacillota bacterium]